MQPYREGTRVHPDAQAHLEPQEQLHTQDQPETRPQRETRGTRARPGTPSLLRELNDRAALGLLLGGEMLTRSQISEYTGVSKVTVSQMLTRLEERGLVAIAGEQAGGRGPNAALYSVVPSSAYVAGLYVESDLVSAAVADVTGRRVAEVSGNPNGADEPVELVRRTVERACASAGIEVTRLSALVIGSPGVVDPRTGDPRLAVNLPAWHEGALDALKGAWHKPVVIENDVNLAAMAERAVGAAVGADDFVLVWLGVGLGLATILGGQLHRGTAGAAGEIGYLPVHGAPLHTDLRHPASGGFQSLAGGSAVRELAVKYGFAAQTPAEAVQAALAGHQDAKQASPAEQASGAEGFLSELAHRVAVGVASVCVVLDPGLVVLSGEVGRAGGTA
ncbi:MAG: ROK family transcriptional regulator, partial [Streptosporangiaceae bacterium]